MPSFFYITDIIVTLKSKSAAASLLVCDHLFDDKEHTQFQHFFVCHEKKMGSCQTVGHQVVEIGKN